jgi:hypothetical protein
MVTQNSICFGLLEQGIYAALPDPSTCNNKAVKIPKNERHNDVSPREVANRL